MKQGIYSQGTKMNFSLTIQSSLRCYCFCAVLNTSPPANVQSEFCFQGKVRMLVCYSPFFCEFLGVEGGLELLPKQKFLPNFL